MQNMVQVQQEASQALASHPDRIGAAVAAQMRNVPLSVPPEVIAQMPDAGPGIDGAATRRHVDSIRGGAKPTREHDDASVSRPAERGSLGVNGPAVGEPKGVNGPAERGSESFNGPAERGPEEQPERDVSRH